MTATTGQAAPAADRANEAAAAAMLVDDLLDELSDLEAHELELVLRYGTRSLRPEQIPPATGWDVCLALAGRGGGKTHMGGAWFLQQARRLPGGRGALVARTAADVRDTMLYGGSGVLTLCPPWFAPHHEKTARCVVFPNGFEAHLYSAEKPDLLRGPQHYVAWGDEFAAWKRVKDAKGGDAWSNLQDGLRLGEHPQVLLTTTPRHTEALLDVALGPRDERTGRRALDKDVLRTPEWSLVTRTKDELQREVVHRTLVRRWSTERNALNLAAGFAAKRRMRYGDSDLGRQELDALLTLASEFALWTQDAIDDHRLEGQDTDRERLVVAIDPTRSQLRPKDEAGIVAAARGKNGHAYVLEDATLRGSPFDWATRALQVASKWGADDIIYESNGLDQSTRDTLIVVGRSSGMRWSARTSQEDKRSRAEPVQALYRAGLVHHIGPFEAFELLEFEMTTWDARDWRSSPNRLDALVIALTELMLGPDKKPRRYVAPVGLGGGSQARRH